MKAIIDKQTNKCKGFGFIDFETNEDAQLAITQLQKKGFTAQLAKVNSSCLSTREREQSDSSFSLLNNKNKIQLIYILLIWILK